MAAIEFTPEVNEDFYNRLAGKISAKAGEQRGTRRGEALSRNITGDPWEGSAVGQIDAAEQGGLADLGANMAYTTAGMNREERLGEQSRGYQVEDRNFSAAEAEKMRAFQEKMAKQGYDWRSGEASAENRRNQQSALWQMPFQLGGMALGGWAGAGARGFGRS